MKKLLGLLWLIIIPLMVGCEVNHTEDYLSQMTELTETEIIEARIDFTKSTYYVTHKLVLNPEETLYYAPKKVQDGENIYLNEQEVFFIITVDPVFRTKTARKVTDEELELIFD